jgi:hypothetical protein
MGKGSIAELLIISRKPKKLCPGQRLLLLSIKWATKIVCIGVAAYVA